MTNGCTIFSQGSLVVQYANNSELETVGDDTARAVCCYSTFDLMQSVAQVMAGKSKL